MASRYESLKNGDSRALQLDGLFQELLLLLLLVFLNLATPHDKLLSAVFMVLSIALLIHYSSSESA